MKDASGDSVAAAESTTREKLYAMEMPEMMEMMAADQWCPQVFCLLGATPGQQAQQMRIRGPAAYQGCWMMSIDGDHRGLLATTSQHYL